MMLRAIMPCAPWPTGLVSTIRPSMATATEHGEGSAQVLPLRGPGESQPKNLGAGKQDISNIKILVSEDESLARIALIDLLGEYLLLDTDKNFLEADNLTSALAVFEQQQATIRAILSDIDMPEKYAGLRLHNELRTHFGFTGPIALMSARPAHDEQIAAIVNADPDTNFFPKPIVDIEAIGDWLRRGWA